MTAVEHHESSETPPVQRRSADLIRGNERLRIDVERLTAENARLAEGLATLQRVRRSEQEMRRAALNLMEDAIRARAAEQQESAKRQIVEEELRHANDRKDEFLATLAHELRNPLSAIHNSVHLMQIADLDPEVVAHAQEVLERQVGHLVRLVDDLMQVSRITQGRIELRKQRVALSTVICHALETCEANIEAAGHHLTVNLPSEPVYLEADPVRLAQVFVNLLNNSAKYTDAAGQISLAATCEGSSASVSIKDSGIGIAREILPRVFDLFMQADRSGRRAQGGLGIGLSLVKSLVEGHGGTVSVQSEGVGQGSEFTVRLPMLMDATKEAQTGQPQESSVLVHAARILVVDDNRDAADTLAMLLVAIGGDVQIANDGLKALEQFKSWRPDLVILDIGMPEMDGYEVAKRLRGIPGGDQARLVALSGWGQPQDVERSIAVGFDQHLVKPVDMNAVRVIMDSLASRNGAGKQCGKGAHSEGAASREQPPPREIQNLPPRTAGS